MANPNPSNKFSKDRQPDRSKQSPRQKILAALERAGKSELDYLDECIRVAMSGEVAMMKEVLLRISPVPKAVSPAIEFDYPEAGTPVEKIDAIIKGVAEGAIPTDMASQIVSMIRSSMEAQEITDVLERIEKLERMLSGGVNGQEAGE